MMLKKLSLENSLFAQTLKILVVNAASEKRVLDDAIKILKAKPSSQANETEFIVINSFLFVIN